MVIVSVNFRVCLPDPTVLVIIKLERRYKVPVKPPFIISTIPCLLT